MSKKTVAIDIDDVLSTHAQDFVAFSNERWSTRLTVDDYNEHWSQMWAVDHQEAERRVHELQKERIVLRYGYRPEARAVLAELKKTYKLVIVTSRRKQLALDTQDWLQRCFPDIFDEVHFAGIWDNTNRTAHLATKAAMCQEIGVDYLIDDQLKHCFAAAESGITALLFGAYAWNRIEKLPQKVVRVQSWKNIREFFDGQS